MEFLTNLLENSTMPWLTAFLLGLMTSISPCPLATNITAIGYISREIENRNRVFITGLLYTLGRALSYTVIAAVIFFGADQMQIGGFFQQHGEKIAGPLLLIIGLFMLDFIPVRFSGLNLINSFIRDKKKWGYTDAIFLGIIFALAFCPYSGVLYFGMLIPLSITSASGLYLPVVFAVATGIPVLIVAWIIAFTISGIGKAYNRLKSFELWFRKVIAVLFLVIGIYYILKIYFHVF